MPTFFQKLQEAFSRPQPDKYDVFTYHRLTAIKGKKDVPEKLQMFSWG